MSKDIWNKIHKANNVENNLESASKIEPINAQDLNDILKSEEKVLVY